MSKVLSRYLNMGDLAPVFTTYLADNGSQGWFLFAELGLKALPEHYLQSLGSPDPLLFELMGCPALGRVITDIPVDFKSVDAAPFFKAPLEHGKAFWSEQKNLLWLYLCSHADTRPNGGG
ncbi:hypothetical protein [Gallaecimonas mangrovi]|uniref:hypothetical protein n=1 Tax=Gallaecimonas mangrovi TaxID=2291597 RepID=UPI000E204EFE|nr:hypothetical protein [Gallaecimonas mangrovi]